MQGNIGCVGSWFCHRPADEVEGCFGEAEYALTFGGEGVNFAWSVTVHVPFAQKVAFLFESRQHGVDSAWSKVDSEASAYVSYNLVAMHGLILQHLKHDNVQQSFG